ncbi:mechanosensitive ion channel family protein [Methylibium petroleiphilum]|uniref:mechanosensitive ion channel family protein n=1 Tax=Methylibium petroleiphilum TaxID=105560 RepID=UPI001AC4B572|nr:mechanosensitive ion channel domain-containing protein [Methylibium petroleiphilum]MBN9203290.1 mechanosensitive ion channel [Methylibium petroleiphilum]
MARPMTPDELSALGSALLTTNAALELAVLGGCLLLAWALARTLRGRREDPHSVLFGRRLVDGALFPLLSLGLVLAAQHLLLTVLHLPPAVLRIAVALLLSLALIRVFVRVLRAAFPASAFVRIVERWLSWAVWVGMILWFTGVLPMLMEELEGISWKVGSDRISLRALLEGAFNAVIVLMLALWLSAAIEARLLKGRLTDLSLRKIAANATRALLLFVGLLMALSAAGIDLTALSVFGGAIGVGLGFGLQKLASNYVSGFVVLAERSLRIGDLVKVDNFEGRITDINTRATIIRAANGRESIVPNELLITQRVENASQTDPSLQLSTVVQVAYGTDILSLRPKLLDALGSIERVMKDEKHRAVVHLSNFAADGLELTVWYWVPDPLNGQSNLRSEVNLAILAVLDAEGIEIPFPQRVLRRVPPAHKPPSAASQPP